MTVHQQPIHVLSDLSQATKRLRASCQRLVSITNRQPAEGFVVSIPLKISKSFVQVHAHGHGHRQMLDIE
jgi:hypothetical protein